MHIKSYEMHIKSNEEIKYLWWCAATELALQISHLVDMEPITLRQAIEHNWTGPFAILVEITKQTNMDSFEIKDSSMANVAMEVSNERTASKKLIEVGLKLKIVNPILDIV